MSTSQAFYELTPEPDGESDQVAGVVDEDGDVELDGDLNEDEVDSYGADQKAAMSGEVTDDETQA